jgi:hypothetical protein
MATQAPKNKIIDYRTLPISGTIIKTELDKFPFKLFFELPFFDTKAETRLSNGIIGRTLFLKNWESNKIKNGTIIEFKFNEDANGTQSNINDDFTELDRLIAEYLNEYLAQKNAPAVQPAAVSNSGPMVADMTDVKVGDPYFILPKTQIQVYVETIFNIPTYYFFITGQIADSWVANEINSVISRSNYIALNTNFVAKVKDFLYKVGFEFKTSNIPQQEYLFLDIDNKLMDLGWVNPNVTAAQEKTTSAQKTDALLDIEANVQKLKTELEQLVFLRSLNSDLDFEKNIEIGQKIAKVKEKINELNFSKLESKLTTDDLVDQMFEQSFAPLQHQYTDLKITQPEEAEFFTPNGQASELSDQLNELIRTQQFKDWFGNWELTYMYKQAGETDTDCSVVLTENFEPKLFYHGTRFEFSYFKFDKFPAAYFAANKAYSQFFADLQSGHEGYVIPFFLNVRNPLDLTNFGTELISTKDFFDTMYLKTGLDAQQLEVNPMFNDPTLPPLECWRYLRNNPKMLKKLADNQVFDGIHFYETNPGIDEGLPAYRTEVFITFKADQCKIADNNRGLLLMASLKSFLLKRGGKI